MPKYSVGFHHPLSSSPMVVLLPLWMEVSWVQSVVIHLLILLSLLHSLHSYFSLRNDLHPHVWDGNTYSTYADWNRVLDGYCISEWMLFYSISSLTRFQSVITLLSTRSIRPFNSMSCAASLQIIGRTDDDYRSIIIPRVLYLTSLGW